MSKLTENYPDSNLPDDQLKELALKIHQTQQTVESGFTTETIDLPSKGLLYPEDNLLHKGQIEMRYMTAKDEDILTSVNLIKSGKVFDKLMQSLIVTPINYNELLVADKNAILIASRILGYGKDYQTEVTCPNCEVKSKKTFDLTDLKDKEVDESLYKTGENSFDFILPKAQKTVTFKLLTHADEQAIDAEITKLKKYAKSSGIDPLVTTRLFYSIIAIDGDTERKNIRSFINSMLAIDSRVLRNYIKDITPTINTEVQFDCDNCGAEEMIEIPIDVNFFWPKA